MLKIVSVIFFIQLAMPWNMVAQGPKLKTFPIAYNLQFPTDVVATPDGRLFIAQLNSKISVFQDFNLLAQPLIDLSEKAGNEGVFGIAIHPNFQQNGYVFVHYVDKNNQNSVYARYTMSASIPNSLDVATEQIIIRIPYTAAGHRGGHFSFGPDGYLYIATGDGCAGARGMVCDPTALAQQYDNLFGKLLRINVDAALPYTIPADNPYIAANDGKLDEIWAVGLRNPWAWSFDTNGDLYMADIGHDAYDELNLIPAGGGAGLNYGWPCYEASSPYMPNCMNNTISYQMPQWQYPGYLFNNIGFSIVGGQVYRKNQFKTLSGYYVFADYQQGGIYTMKTGQNNQVLQAINIPNITALACTEQGIWATRFDAGQLYYIYVQQIKSNKSGPWNDPLTWTCNCLPGPDNEVFIQAGHTVSLAENKTVYYAQIEGNLTLLNNAQLNTSHQP